MINLNIANIQAQSLNYNPSRINFISYILIMFSWVSGGSYVSVNFLNFSIDFMIPISIICNLVYKLQSDQFENQIFFEKF